MASLTIKHDSINNNMLWEELNIGAVTAFKMNNAKYLSFFKQGQTGLNRDKWVKIGPNGVKQGQTWSNRAKQCKTGPTAPNRANRDQMGPTRDNWG